MYKMIFMLIIENTHTNMFFGKEAREFDFRLFGAMVLGK